MPRLDQRAGARLATPARERQASGGSSGSRATKRQIGLVHVAKAKLKLSEEAYRLILSRAGGVDTSTHLDRDGFLRVMREFKRLGFEWDESPTISDDSRQPGRATQAQIDAIKAAWRQFTGQEDERALSRWIDKHLRVSHLRFLDAVAAGKCVAILNRMVRWKARRTTASVASVSQSATS